MSGLCFKYSSVVLERIVTVNLLQLNIYRFGEKYVFKVDDFKRIFNYKSTDYLKTYYGFQMIYNDYTNLENILSFLNRSRKPYARNVAKIILDELKLNYITSDSKESNILKLVVDFLDKSEEYVCQYNVDMKYKIDMYFPKMKIAFEIDEFNHINRDPMAEKIRETYIINKLFILFFLK